MRILFLTHRLPYAPNRGDRIRAYYLLQEMARFADVSVFSLVHDADEASHLGDVPFARQVIGAPVPRLRSMAQGALGLVSSRALTLSLLDSPGARASLAAIVERDRPDLVVVSSSGMARFALEPPLADIPFVMDMVDVDSEKWAELGRRARGPWRWIYRREASLLKVFEAHAARQAAATLVVNHREERAMLRLAPDAHVRVVENGVDLQAFVPQRPPEDSSTVVFCGVMNYPPNEDAVRWFAAEIWPLVRRRTPEARFVVVGADPTRAVRAAAAADGSIEVVGRVPAVQPYLWRSAVSVAPLRMTRGLQNKVLEALAAGLPVVATPAVMDGLPVEARRGCTEAAEAEDFAARVVELLGVPPAERRERASAAGVDGLTWPDQLRPLEGILTAAASPPGFIYRASTR
jgi:sugar transferase (PEP-CTERM/EpsH1 system associated)